MCHLVFFFIQKGNKNCVSFKEEENKKRFVNHSKMWSVSFREGNKKDMGDSVSFVRGAGIRGVSVVGWEVVGNGGR